MPNPPFSCKTCDCFVSANPKNQESGGACHGNPPVPFILGIAQPKFVGAEPEVVSRNFYPGVMPNDWCAKHQLFPAWRAARLNGAAEPEVAYIVPMLGPTEPVAQPLQQESKTDV